MIPIKIELKNFLSYGSAIQTVDFADHSLICFSGKNGNGKSALLDAMTWALWGQARKVSGTIKPDDGLLHLGQTKMMVSLKFKFAKNIYRVRREYAKTYGKSILVLDLEVFDEKNKKFLSLTEKSVKRTQQAIEKLLGLDYLTFTNSAFLRQGRADEFSKKTPRERKKILSNILGLDRFEALTSLALQKSREMIQDYNIGLKLQENDKTEILKEEHYLNELVQIKEKQTYLNKLIKKEESVLKRNEDIFSEFLKKKEQFLFFEKQKIDLQKKYDLKIIDFKLLVFSWRKFLYKRQKLPSFDELNKNKLALEKKDQELVVLHSKSLDLQENIFKQKKLYHEKYFELKQETEKEKNKTHLYLQKMEIDIEQGKKNLEQKEKDLKLTLNKKESLLKEVNSLSKELLKLPEHKKKLELYQKKFEKRKGYYQLLIQRGNWIKNSIIELKEKYETIKKQDSPACPLCEQVLTLKRKQFLADKFLKEINLFKHHLVRPTRLITELKKILLIQYEELNSLRLNDEHYKKQKARIDELGKNLLDFDKKISSLDKEILSSKIEIKKLSDLLKKKLDEYSKLKIAIEKEISQNKELLKIKTDLDLLEKNNQLLKYDFENHKKIQKQLKSIVKDVSELQQLKNNNETQKYSRTKITLQIQYLRDLKSQIKFLDDKMKNLDFDIELEGKLKKNLKDLTELLIVKNKKNEKLNQDRNLLDYELKKISELKIKLKNKDKDLLLLKNSLADYQIIAQAFGKNGIQALLIEQAIPQIEEEANSILSRLTNNQSQIFIESLRDLKSGGVKETLDIKISDSAGIRPYEMFSGGEAFRIDFALRIAISKLLARRAGIALQTLIIDEGFGSQDEMGLSKVMDAIYAIKQDFSKVIIVSHLASFKDNFPVHFIINKNASGSFIQVEERG